MTSQQEKYILDATAGFRMMWFDKHDPNTLYIDQRPECEPDEIQDYRKLPYPDESFKLIVFDPPHLIKGEDFANQNTLRRFGWLQAETWQSDLKKAFTELWRVLQPYGILVFKWNNFSAPSNVIIDLFPVKPLFYNVISSNQTKISEKNSSRAVRTLWFCFMKKPSSVGVK